MLHKANKGKIPDLRWCGREEVAAGHWVLAVEEQKLLGG